MAFQNTSERYQYIYGSNATRLDETGRDAGKGAKRAGVTSAKKAASRPERTVDAEKEAAILKNRQKLQAFDWKFTVVAAVAVLFCAAASLFYIDGTVRLNELSSQVSELKSEKAELMSKKAALQTEIDKSINLDEIRKFAKDDLHMIYPDPDHTIYYNDSASDYFRQYESVSAGK